MINNSTNIPFIYTELDNLEKLDKQEEVKLRKNTTLTDRQPTPKYTRKRTNAIIGNISSFFHTDSEQM